MNKHDNGEDILYTKTQIQKKTSRTKDIFGETVVDYTFSLFNT